MELVKNTIVLLLIIRIRAAVSCKKKKSTPVPVCERPVKGWILKLWHTVSVLALSVTYGDTSPKGRGLGKEMKFAWTAKGSHFGGAGIAQR